MPVQYATRICPPDLLATNVNVLAGHSEAVVRIRSVDGIARAIFPRDRVPISHALLVEALDFEEMNVEATLSDVHLRITAVHTSSREAQPGDAFAYGWEVTNAHDGWTELSAWRFVKRLICENGMVSFDRRPLFRRSPSTHRPLLGDLDRLSAILKEEADAFDLEPALGWASQQLLGNGRDTVVDYLSRQLDGPATKLALEDVTPKDTFYHLMNRITALGRTHRLTQRRRHEAEGGVLLSWFLAQGRRRPPWQRRMCDECEVRMDGSQA